MSFESITDQRIEELLCMPKKVTNPGSRAKSKEGHEQFNYILRSVDDESLTFTLYKRQNLRPGMDDAFSCGLSWNAPNGETLTLVRYNGPNHVHANPIEGQTIRYSSHIHRASERYIRALRKPESFAEETDRYNTLRGALHCLVTDCSIAGLVTTAEEPNLPFL